MGRPKKTIDKNKEIEKDNIKHDNNENTNVEDLKKENEQLKNELDEIKKMLVNLTQNQNKTQTQNIPVIANNKQYIEEDNEDSFEIKPNKFIKVMSLNFGKLVLTTEARGQGKPFIFNKFGDVRNIVYSDLSNIVHNHQSFAENGRFYIFDKNFVRNHGLSEYYNKFLTKDIIENILNYNSDEIVSLFKNTTDVQKDIIVNLLIKKIINGEEVDISKVDIVSRLTNINIFDTARAKMNNEEE
jgi:hypothetical protein